MCILPQFLKLPLCKNETGINKVLWNPFQIQTAELRRVFPGWDEVTVNVITVQVTCPGWGAACREKLDCVCTLSALAWGPRFSGA